MRIKSLILAALCMVTVGVYAQSNYPFNGLDMNMGNLSRLSDAKTRSISPENFTGEKGKGGMADPVRDKLALPYLGGVDSDDAIYANTRRFVWSEYNPYFFKGSYFEGIGGHHIGTDMIWPMSLIMKALTAQDDKELQQCIQMLQKTHAGTGFMHESFHKDDPKKFTRSWFAWANTLFGELLWKTFNEKPYLLEY